MDVFWRLVFCNRFFLLNRMVKVVKRWCIDKNGCGVFM